MKTCRVIQHVLFEDLGTWGDKLQEHGYALHFHQAGVSPPSGEEWLSADLAAVLGGPVGVGDLEAYPFLAGELDLVARRVKAGRPLIGICLGAQLIAKAMGARVFPNSRKEIGWSALTLTEAGRRSPVLRLEGAEVLHWHGDTFDLPEGAILLASTEITRNQCFSAGENILALQFHPEADSARLEQWLIGHACELGQAGIDPRSLRADGERCGGALREKGRLLLEEWLGGLRP
ncbi:MAG: glutamine amidotransferase [Deltaproteobacteria bacterium]|jgi:GMP synthase (glutamine-hydrolysing)|nr:glutamine amidotransferase [Deltaproteobacteria bacterium]